MLLDAPTADPEINLLLQELYENVQRLLGAHLIGMYLEGSLANGGFDRESDIDFVVVCDLDVSGDLFSALLGMHDQLSRIDNPWQTELEGSYMSLQGVRRYDPEHTLHPNLERGVGERLKMADHQQDWAIHRYILFNKGITLYGPPPETLIDPVSTAELRQAVQTAFNGWAANILQHPEILRQRGYQSYVVLSLCRMLYTLQFSEVVSKLTAASWAEKVLGNPWQDLIKRAWTGRSQTDTPSLDEDIQLTLDFIRFATHHGALTLST